MAGLVRFVTESNQSLIYVLEISVTTDHVANGSQLESNGLEAKLHHQNQRKLN